jgi:membrane-bound lytic murein transglycosylase
MQVELQKIFSNLQKESSDFWEKCIWNLANDLESQEIEHKMQETAFLNLKKQMDEKNRELENTRRYYDPEITILKNEKSHLRIKVNNLETDLQKMKLMNQSKIQQQTTNVQEKEQTLQSRISSLTAELNQKNKTLKFLVFFFILALLLLGIFSWIKIRTKKVKKV